VDELDLCRLLRHSSGNFRDSVPDEVHGSGAGEIEILLAGGDPNVNAFAADGRGEVFAKRSA
jgi:hypothetical protein